MKYSCHLLIGLLALFLCGCGTTVRESLKVQTATKSPVGIDKTVVILPFADYSYADNLESAYRRDLFIYENLTDQFVKNSFNLPNQEDVILYLIEHNIINVGSINSKKATSLEQELSKDWSDQMKKNLQHYIDQAQNGGRNNSVNESSGTHGLTQQEIVKIGRHFSADYIVRGRIIQYKDRLDPYWEPWKKGVVPFVVGVGGRTLFGNANTEKYDEWGSSRSSDTSRVLSGDVPQAVVQVRVWIQDAYTGNVIWTNRIDVKASPKSFLVDNKYDVLFEEATEKAITTLVDDFVQVLYREPVAASTTVSPDTDKDGVPDVADHCPNTRLGTAVNALGCPAKETLVLEGVNFKTGSALLTPESQRILDRTASALIHAPQVKVEVAGHTDSVGDAKRNLDLSNNRSLAVVQYLTSKGVAATQLTSKGYGEEKPIASNATPEGRQINRRTELHPMTR